jgi:DNA ligase (NAD+)
MAIAIGSRTFKNVGALEKLVIHAATEYALHGYVEDFDGVEVTDPEYDALFKELRKLKPKSKAFEGTSPATADMDGDIVKHDPPMTSIEKSDGEPAEKVDIYQKWRQDCADELVLDDVDDLEIAGSYKRDGLALRVNYVRGKLISAGLRPRDGVNGTDVTRHMPNIAGVPMTLPHPYTLSLNGEIECWLADFDKVNAERDTAGEDAYKNPRNYTAGCLGRDDPKETKGARLRVAWYGITGFVDWRKHYKTAVERAKWVNSTKNGGLGIKDGKKGYFVQVRVHKFDHLKMMEDFASNLPYYTDGIVLMVNDLDQFGELGHRGDDVVKPPRGALAWKYAEETAEAVVTSVDWKASRTGRVVPTAEFDTPFVLADTENSRATCNNFGWMEAQGLGPGAKVECKKGGKIIPNIMRVIDPVKSVGAPANCPSCGTKLQLHTSDSGNKDLLCNNKGCPAKQIKGWIFYLQKLACKGIGASAMELICNSGTVSSLAGLYTMDLDDLTPHGFSERQATLAMACVHKVKPGKPEDNDKLLAKIEKAKKVKQSVPAWQFFAALGIPGAGETAGKALVAHFQSFDKIRQASTDELLEVDGIGDTTAPAIHDWFDQEGYTLVDDLLEHIELELPKTGKLSGTNFVLTGAFDGGKKVWQKKVEDLGGNIQGSVGSKTNYLVAGKDVGKGKTDKAKKYGVPIITVDDLEEML